MKPTANRLLVKVVPEEVKPVVLTKEGKEKEAPITPPVKGNTPLIAEVIDAGPDCKEIGWGCKVMFSPYGFDEVIIDGEKLVIIGEDMILAYEERKKSK